MGSYKWGYKSPNRSFKYMGLGFIYRGLKNKNRTYYCLVTRLITVTSQHILG